MQKLVWQNANGDSIDLTSGNYGITQWEGFSNTSLNIQSQQVPFQDGGVFLDALIEQRELSVTLKMQDNGNLQERYRMRRELVHILNPKLGEGYLIYTNDFISKRIKCVAQVPLFETHNSNDSGTPKASLAWTACEPYWEDLEETSVFLKSGERYIINNEGDVDIGIKVTSYGELEDFSVINQNTEKNISLKGNISGKVLINTNIGKKEVIKSVGTLHYLQGSEYRGLIERFGNIVVCGFSILVYPNYNNSVINVNTDVVINDIEQNSDIVVAGGVGGALYYSNNLKSWTKIQVGSSDISLIEYSTNKFYLKDVYNSQYESSDGTTWTSTSGHVFTKDKNKIYKNSMYYRINNHDYKSYLQKSEDNSNWVDIAEFALGQFHLSENKNNIIVYGSFGTIAYVDIEENVRFIKGGVNEGIIYDSIFLNKKIYCFGRYNTAFYTEDNFSNLTNFNIDTGNIHYYSVLKKGDVIIIIGADDSNFVTNVYRSTDSLQTLQKLQPDVSYPMDDSRRAKIYNNKFYLITSKIWESSDGINWVGYDCVYENDNHFVCRDFIITEDNVCYAVDNNGDIYKANSLGETFTNIQGEHFYENIELGDGFIIFTKSTGELIKLNLENNAKTILYAYGSSSHYSWKIKKIGSLFYVCGQDFNLVTDGNYVININGFLTPMYYNIQKTNDRMFYMGDSDYLEQGIISVIEDIETNIIEKLKINSDMSLKLKVGSNDMLVLNNANSANVLSYRQKYIGV